MLESQKSDTVPIIIYANLECIIAKTDLCKNNPENLSTTKASEHLPSGFPMSTIFSFRSVVNKHDVYRGKDCMNTFCEFLRVFARVYFMMAVFTQECIYAELFLKSVFHDGGRTHDLSQKKRTRCLWFFSLCFITVHHKSFFDSYYLYCYTVSNDSVILI